MNSDKQILIDTSAWISLFRGECSAEMQEFAKRCITERRAVTCHIIILELLQGCTTKTERDDLQQELEALHILPLIENVWSFSYDVGFKLRRSGITIPTVDIIIASLAIVNDCALLHLDRRFQLMHNYFNTLSLLSM